MRTARKFGAVPVAFSSAEKASRCWDGQWLDKSKDIAAVCVCGLPCPLYMPASVHPADSTMGCHENALAQARGQLEALCGCLRRPLPGAVPACCGVVS